VAGEAKGADEAGAWWTLDAVEHPWHFGVQAGYVYNTLYQGGAEGHYTTGSWHGGHGWHAALLVRYQIFNWRAVQAEPAYIQKNYRLKWSGAYERFNWYNDTTNGFIDFSLLAHLSTALDARRRVRLFATGGGFAGVWAHGGDAGLGLAAQSGHPFYGWTTSSVHRYDVDYAFDDERDNRFDGGLLCGLGVQLDREAFSVFLECRLHYGFTDLQKTYQARAFAPKMNDALSILVGVLIRPGVLRERAQEHEGTDAKGNEEAKKAEGNEEAKKAEGNEKAE
jgi:hypothetical protein